MQVESSEPSPISNTEMADDEDKYGNHLYTHAGRFLIMAVCYRLNEQVITVEDLYLLCDLFYLPFEHGSRGFKLLNEFNWLKANASVLLFGRKKDEAPKPEVRLYAITYYVICLDLDYFNRGKSTYTL